MSALPIDYPPRPERGVRTAALLQFPQRRDPSASGVPRAGVRITRRGRLLVTLLVSLAIGSVALVGAAGAVAVHEPSRAPAVQTVQVLPGDTLWSIASGITAPGQDVRDVIADVVQLNGLDTSAIYVGQQLTVPLADQR